MRKGISLLAALITCAAMIFTGCDTIGIHIPSESKLISRSGEIVEGEFSVTEQITELNIGGFADIYLYPEDSDTISYTVDKNLAEYLKIELENGELSIWLDVYSITFDDLSEGFEIHIGTDSLTKLNLSDAVDVFGQGTFEADSAEFNLSGAASCELDINAEKLMLNLSGGATASIRGDFTQTDANVSGGTDLYISGTADEAVFTVSGGSDVFAYDLVSQAVKVDVSGAGEAQVYSSNSLQARASGASTIRYKGSPKNVSASDSGASSIKKAD